MEHSIYLLVNCNDFFKQSIKKINYTLSEMERDQYDQGIYTLEQLFKANNIPEKYRKIIFYISCDNNKFNAKELLTGYNFNNIEGLNKKMNGFNLLSIRNYNVYDDESKDSIIKFETLYSNKNIINGIEVDIFIQLLKDLDLLEKYKCIINEYFEIGKEPIQKIKVLNNK